MPNLRLPRLRLPNLSPAQKAVWTLAFAQIVLVLAFGGLVGYLKYDSVQKDHQIRVAAKQAQVLAHKASIRADRLERANCSLRLDLETRIKNGQKFLARNPNGGLGFTRREIQVQIDNQKRTVKALSGLHCQEKSAQHQPKRTP